MKKIFQVGSFVLIKIVKKQPIPELSKNEFGALVEILKHAYQVFCLRRIGNNEIGKDPNTDPYNKNILIWDTIIMSLRNDYLINLAKVFDSESFEEKNGIKYNLSIFRAISRDKFHLNSKSTIGKLLKIRNKLVAHLDATAITEREVFEKNYGLNDKNIELLFNNTFELINKMGINFGFAYILDATEERNFIEEKFKRWYANFLTINNQTIF